MEKFLKKKQRISARVDYDDYKWICARFGTSSDTQFVNNLMRYYLIREKWFNDAANRGENLVTAAPVIPPPERSEHYAAYLVDINSAPNRVTLETIEKELTKDPAVTTFEKHDLLRKLRGKKETLK